MATLHVDLQDGFDRDDVVIALDDGAATRRVTATTDYSVGLAAAEQFTELEPGDHTIDISVPARSLTARWTVTVDGDLYMAVSIDDGGLAVESRPEAFHYF